MSLIVEQVLTGYQAALTGAAFYRVSQGGYLRISGPDRFPFIQRQTTNDIRALAPGRALLSVLTSATARILDVWRMVVEPGSERICVITLPGRSPATLRHLQKHIFFMDKVTVTDASSELAQIEIIGPAAEKVLNECGLGPLPEPDGVSVYPFEAGQVYAIGLDQDRTLLLAPPDRVESLATRLERADAVALDASGYGLLRVEAGRPGPYELTDEYTPLEMNLDAAISGTKGCYTGQEIIARQVTYDKVTRRLVGVRLAAPVASGTAIQVEGRTVGAITSVASSPRWGEIALAVIKRPHYVPGTAVTVLHEGRTVEAVTAALPFAG